MNKTEFRKLLGKKGYLMPADDTGIPTVLSPDDKYKNMIKEVKQLAAENNYVESFAVKKADRAKLAALAANDDTEDDAIEDIQKETQNDIDNENIAVSPKNAPKTEGSKEPAGNGVVETAKEEEQSEENTQTTTVPDIFDMFLDESWLFNDEF